MRITNRHNLPPALVRLLTTDDYSKGDADRSITGLINPPQIELLRKEYDDQIVTDVSDMVYSVLGRSVHYMLQHSAGDDHIAEERLSTEIEGWKISGAVDLQYVDGNMVDISDYKVTSVWSVMFGDKPEWEAQLNCYAWLVRRVKGLEPRNLSIVAILRDRNKREAMKRRDYPQSDVELVPIKLWTEEEQENYVRERVKLHQRAAYAHMTGGDIPPCSEEETWAKPTTYAVMKKGRKAALRVLDSFNEASEYVKGQKDQKGLHIEKRSGDRSRCSGDYCSVSAFCPQYQKWLAKPVDLIDVIEALQ